LTTFGRNLAHGGSRIALVCALVGLVLTLITSIWAISFTLGLMLTARKYVLGLATEEQFSAIEAG
jgi:hypothetical protein